MQQSQSWGHADVKGRIYVALLRGVAEAKLDYSVGVDGVVVKVGSATVFQPDVVVFAGRMARSEIIAREPLHRCRGSVAIHGAAGTSR